MIAEDQTMVRQALVALLELEPDIEVVAQAATGEEALAMAAKQRPDVAVLDTAHGTGPRPCSLRTRRAGCSRDAAR
jgi:DNA-binding NarL/FixJ family response regulator